MKNLLLIALLAFTAQAYSSEVIESEKSCKMMEPGKRYLLSEDRCPGITKGTYLLWLQPVDAIRYCDIDFAIVDNGSGFIYCTYNGKKIEDLQEITATEKGRKYVR